MLTLDDKVIELNKVGKALGSRLKHLGIETVKDLIFYYPFRYDDFSQLVKIGDLKAGMVVTTMGKVELLASHRSPRQRKILTEAVISDDSGSVKVIWFNQPWIGKSLKPGDEIFLSGKVSGDLFNAYFSSPNYEKASAGNLNTARLVPVYSATEGITQKQLRYLIKSILPLTEKVSDFLPPDVIKSQKLWSLGRALREIHFPQNQESLAKARERLGFDELFLIQLWSQVIKENLSQEKARPIKFFEKETKAFVSRLDFDLTFDQKKSAWEIIKNLAGDRPMNRLLEGDVGSGKTLVAALAIFNVALNGFQSVLMAPTEILARQHFNTLSQLFKNTKIKIGLMSRTQKIIGEEKVSRKDFLAASQKGKIQVIVGTHAVIQAEVKFKSLTLAVIDEQHRFGVKQRWALKEKSEFMPHFLSLTATPIPRTLALAVYGDLDFSIIRQMPKGRKSILTKIVAPEKRRLAYEFIAKQIGAGRQVFVICPLIDPSDKLGVRSVTQEFEKLDKEVFPHLSVGLLHGRLKGAAKEKVMADFVQNKTKILVATSVVEVGVDVPNAAVMMIEGAERFGLAQLHQFRGRVGRSEHQSFCFLFSDSGDQKSFERLTALVNCQDGFELAEKDLAFRGAGQIFGYEQSGFADLKIASLSDSALIKRTREAAQNFISKNKISDFPELSAKLDSLGFSSHLE